MKSQKIIDAINEAFKDETVCSVELCHDKADTKSKFTRIVTCRFDKIPHLLEPISENVIALVREKIAELAIVKNSYIIVYRMEKVKFVQPEIIKV